MSAASFWVAESDEKIEEGEKIVRRKYRTKHGKSFGIVARVPIVSSAALDAMIEADLDKMRDTFCRDNDIDVRTIKLIQEVK